MKRKYLTRIAAALATVLLILLIWTCGAPSIAAHAATSGAYGYCIEHFSVEMDVASDRTIAVKEEITCFFTGYSSHGIIRDFPLDNGVRYKNIEVGCDNKDFSPYTQTDALEFLSLYLRGDGIVTNQRRTYTLSYTMIVPALSEEGYLPLDVLGYGWETRIEDFSARITVPEGLQKYNVYSGRYGVQSNSEDISVRKEGNVFYLSAKELSESNSYSAGITLDLKFADGVLKTSFDPSILIAVAVGVILIALAVIAKMFFCRQPIMTTTVNLEAPEKMDPLLMGKLIDNFVDSEDLGALVFYLADQGYLTIDMSEGEKDPTLRVTQKRLSPDVPNHIKIFYEGLFSGRESVRIKSLTNSFYRTAQATTSSVNAQVGKMYSFRSMLFIGLFAVLSVLLLGGFAFIYNLIGVIGGYRYWTAAVACLISFTISAAVSFIVKQREQKWSKKNQTLATLAACLLALVPTIAFLIVRSPAFGAFTGFILVASAAATGAVSGRFLTRTPEYTAKLGHILGFKQFILFTEKDKIAFMLKENPELYYHILPYAQVLGVTDAWTDKFKGLSMQPPAYAYGYSYNAFDVLVWNHMFRHMNGSMARTFVSRPSSSGGGVNRGGGFGGGFGGGGFGGGGGRGC